MKSYQYLLVFLLFISCTNESSNQEQTAITNPGSGNMIREINHKELPIGAKTIAIVGATLIDGTGKPPLSNATVVIKGNSILEVGPSGSLSIPKEAEIVDGKGLTLLPGLIDAHFHLNNNELPNLVLQRGITSVRDPGAWIESYSAVRDSDITPPRLFLTGPHLDMPPPAYPKNSYLIRDPIEARYAVNKFADQGASAIKIYIRLPVAIIKEVCATAHQRGIPVLPGRRGQGHQRRHRTMMQPLEFGEPERSHVGGLPIGVGRNQRHPIKQELETGIGLIKRDLPVWVVALPGVMQGLPPNLIEVGIAPTGFDVGRSVR